LNFVNNFSEINSELIEELKEVIKSGDLEEAKLLSSDIADNEAKIGEHSKRADAIVKGMLQHSRSGGGEKASIDINHLTDEYLRLAYHGMKAKDPSFAVEFRTEFEENLPKVNVVPQDISRVILNLILNAFYTVSQKAMLEEDVEKSYEPSVLVSTIKVENQIEVRISDNGSGIPDDVLDKIFQPFFTTKPSGEGTGLGLSLSYDIITKGHGGELTVVTTEGEGTTFTMSLPG